MKTRLLITIVIIATAILFASFLLFVNSILNERDQSIEDFFPKPTTLTGSAAQQICDIVGITCPESAEFSAMYNPQEDSVFFDYYHQNQKYSFDVSGARICYTINDAEYEECKRRKNNELPKMDGNKSPFLSNSLDYWKQRSRADLRLDYNLYGTGFYTELGKFLIKQEFKEKLVRQNISNAHEDIMVFSGYSLQSLPPIVGYDAVVNSTDGNVYLLEGSVNANEIRGVSIMELVFDNDIIIQASQDTTHVVIELQDEKYRGVVFRYFGQNQQVTFENKMDLPIRIQPDGYNRLEDQDNIPWKTPYIEPNTSYTMTFEILGNHEWNAVFAPKAFEDWFEIVARGEVTVYKEGIIDLPINQRAQMAGNFVHESDLPVRGLGMGNGKGLMVSLPSSIFYMLPDAAEYYKSKIESLIPFDVPVIIEEPNLEE